MNGLRIPRTKAERAASDAERLAWKARSDAEYEERQRQQAQMWRDYHLAQQYEAFRQQQKRMKAQAEAEIDLLAKRLVEVTKSVEAAETGLSRVSKRERLRRHEESVRDAKLDAALKSTEVLAKDVLSTKVSKAVERQKIKRKIVRRDEKNRIVAVDEVMVEI